jgi:hypothetical protein
MQEREPSIVSFLAAVGSLGGVIDELYGALDQGPISPQVRRALEEELAHCEDPQRLVGVLQRERAISISMADHFPGAEVPALVRRALGWPLRRIFLGVLNAYDQQFALAARPWHEAKATLAVTKAGQGANQHGILASLLQPALMAAHQAHAKSLVLTRSLRVFNALSQYRQVHGREAQGLKELNLPAAATIDPYSGEPLKLKLTEEGWLVYSVMENGIDDGGDFRDMQDSGLAPRGWRAP